jgi:N-acetylglucosamine-6-phosphate deacetylase
MTYNELRTALKDLRDNQGVELETTLSGKGVTKETLQAEYDRVMSVKAPISHPDITTVFDHVEAILDTIETQVSNVVTKVVHTFRAMVKFVSRPKALGFA